jgi:excinuclease ABC subunit A
VSIPRAAILIRGARVNNLQGLDCEIPRNRLAVITGPSGSGKSSLAFDTLYAEGQRRYVESLSAYARQFLDQMAKPDVEEILGLQPAIAIEQKTTAGHPRSTVGTVTEIYDHLRVMFSALGQPHCPRCTARIEARSAEQIADLLLGTRLGAPVAVLAPVVRGRKGGFKRELLELKKQGLLRARIDGRAARLDEGVVLDPRRNHRVDVLLDRLILKAESRPRLLQALERSFGLAGDTVLVTFEGGEERLLSRRFACARCGVSLPELSPRAFSFNSPLGACPECDGLGVRWEVDPAKVIPDATRSIAEGAILPWQRVSPRFVREALRGVARRQRLSLDTPFGELPRRARRAILEGDASFPGVLEHIRQRVQAVVRLASEAPDPGPLREGESFEDLKPYLSVERCPQCEGSRLRGESRAVRVAGHSIAELVRLPVPELRATLQGLQFPERDQEVAGRVLREVDSRLQFLEAVGLGYLCLDRTTTTLSTGEAHRVRLATQIGARMQGILYVLDEPSVGLHPRDHRRLLDTLFEIRDRGNTVVVVEHDAETIRAADWVVDLGEGAGRAGGRLMYQGPPESLNGSLTGRYLRRELQLGVPRARREAHGRLVVVGARENNLRDLEVSFPLGVVTAVTGVSGAGKSTLVMETLYRALAQRLHGSAATPGRHREIRGAEAVDKVIAIDQSPIGRTPRSNPATYTGAFAFIRELMSLVPEARARGYKPGRFSFNVRGGRCEGCQGDGVKRVAMHFLPDVYVTCDVCRGRRYNRDTLEILYQGRSIADILELTVEEALGLLRAHPRLQRLFGTLNDVGLGYLRLGQAASTLSGGEAQRVRLARELARRDTGRTLFILDEPTTGLHFDDVGKLLKLLSRLVDAGNSVIVIEHHLDVIKSADWVIDLGPEAGGGGGRVVAAGTPEAVARSRRSHTGRFLRRALQGVVA